MMNLKRSNTNFNMLVCPQCSNLLYDYLADYEVDKSTKSVKCSNTGCDFIGKREGFDLVNPSGYKFVNYNQNLRNQRVLAY